MANKKIRVNTRNSKVVGGKLFISLLKAQQIKSVVLQKLINYSKQARDLAEKAPKHERIGIIETILSGQ